MGESLNLRDLAWALTTFLELLLFAVVLRKRIFLAYPVYSLYLLAVILQSTALAAVYRSIPFRTETAFYIAWGSQGIVALLRGLAIVELVKRILAKYSGLWALSWRLLLLLGVGVTGISLFFAKGMWQWILMNLVRGTELAFAAVIVTLLLLVQFYRLPASRWQRALSFGFCLYSVFYVLNYSLMEKFLQKFADYWSFLSIVAYLATVLLWVRAAVAYRATDEQPAPSPLSPETYRELSSELDQQLNGLNRQLEQLLRSDGRQR